MTPADEARFIQLWSQGASYRAIAQALGIKAGTGFQEQSPENLR